MKLAVVAIAWLVIIAAAARAADTTVWLCRPGIADDPCTPGLDTTEVSPGGGFIGVEHVVANPSPVVDCFYLYPTVSDDPTPNSDLSIDPEERSIALYQAARYSQVCNVFAPMYRQITVTQLLKGLDSVTPEMAEIAYGDVLQAWRNYLTFYNHGHGVVLIGHSQGTGILRRLIADVIDDDPVLRRQLVSAILLGGNVLVKEGETFGGEFRHIRGCTSPADVGCAVAYSTFEGPVPPDSLFGRVSQSGLLGGGDPTRLDILCTNPAALRGGVAPLDPILPTAPFAPGTTIGLATMLVGAVKPPSAVTTAWYEARGSYIGACSSADDANVLQITPVDGAPQLNAVPTAQWGLHLVDGNIALGNLVSLVREQIATWVHRGHDPEHDRF